ncbi:hypothetical protein [Serratia bockelmannii]|uniref:hypothetical protein n=1 Tax=Serratia bockelmannii TaxID=2703793 RepID=UPI00313A888F
MDNKLSELSKPVAWEVKGILCHSEEEAQVYVGEPEPLYSQECVLALLAELEAKDKRIAELDGILEVSQGDLSDTEDAMHLWAERAKTAEAKLATPVRLGAGVLMVSAYSANSCDSEWHLCLARDSVVSAIRAAGFTVEGDE